LIATGWLVASIAFMALWEAAAPRCRRSPERALRWPTSFTLAPLNAVLASVPLPAAALATTMDDRGWGLLNALHAPAWVGGAITVPLLDLVVYLQHRLLHAVPALWAVHRVHHADRAFDVATGLRFHPIEAAVTHGTLLLAVTALGLPVLGVLAYQTIAFLMTLFEHANARLPAGIESRLERVLVTPATHRIHHSVEASASNFATVFPLWDRWLGTYRARRAADDTADVGVRGLRDPKFATLPWTLALPFLSARRVGAPAGASERR